ncbi:unnamed protein product [Dibothriocephalus latus]|uniref:Uncharacterized protein n=1 Tax=Dibothriocephalus latus TaxID=60516 RepID=A0A3P7M4I6_DIBLA|nr:unnamed protein product [Dibothriocephalus latus]
MINFGPRIPSGNLAISPSKNRLSVSTSRHSFSDTHVPMSLVETIDRSSSKQDSTGSNYVYLQQQAEQHLAYKCPMQHMSANTVFSSYAPQAQLSDIVWPLDQMPSTEHLQGYDGNYQGDIPYELNASHPDGFVAKSGPLFYKCPPTDAASQAYAQLSVSPIIHFRALFQ